MLKTYYGSCLCKQVRFSVTAFNDNVASCHCSMCRKFHGSAFATLTSVKGLKWLVGLEWLQDYTADNGTIRTFCSNCGSSIGFRVKDTLFSEIELAIAIFDDDIPVSVVAQIYTQYKANWHELNHDTSIFLAGRKNDVCNTQK